MAPKREKSLLEDPPAASSSEEDEVEEEEVTTVNSSSTVEKPKFDSTSNSGSKTQTPSFDDDEEEDESEESDSEPTPPKLKPLETSRGSNPRARKPIALQPKKTLKTPLASTTKHSTTVKRPLESENDSKQKKKKVDDEDSHPELSERKSTVGPKSIFQRLWSDDDEIVVLKAMIESKKKGVDPMCNLKQFFESIKEYLHVEVRLDQLRNKIKRLRRKYLENFKKERGDAEPVFSKPHEVLSYRLMKEIWDGKEGRTKGGGSAVANDKPDSVVANGKSKSKKSNNGESPVRTKMVSDLPKLDGSNVLLHPCVQEMVHSRNNTYMVGGSFLNQGLDLISDSKRKDFEQKWRMLYVAELKHYLTRIELVRELTVAIIDAYKSSDAQEHG